MRKSVGQAPTAERANKRKKKGVGRHPTSERNGKIVMSDKVQRRTERVKKHTSHNESLVCTSSTVAEIIATEGSLFTYM